MLYAIDFFFKNSKILEKEIYQGSNENEEIDEIEVEVGFNEIAALEDYMVGDNLTIRKISLIKHGFAFKAGNNVVL